MINRALSAADEKIIRGILVNLYTKHEYLKSGLLISADSIGGPASKKRKICPESEPANVGSRHKTCLNCKEQFDT